MDKCIEKAYAKINYQLHVGARRPDGFHEIVTLMQTISLFDEVTVSVTAGDGISLSVVGNASVPEDRRNLAWRAAEAYLEKMGEAHHVDIRLVKHIPMAGGLAGGSADAAAVLRALNRIFDNRFSTQELMTLAATFGSDIPFCVVGGLALCTGRGEAVMPLTPLDGQRHFLIVNRGESVSTGEAYGRIDACGDTGRAPLPWQKCVSALKNDMQGLPDTMENTFEACILPLCPLADEAKQALSANGAVAAMMSGSGSTVYGIFKSRDRALAAQGQLGFPSIYATDVFPFAESVYE